MIFDYNYFAMLEPMKYYDADDLSSQKAQDMINNKGHNYVATKKSDGEWGMFIKGLNGEILIRSRSLSVVTNAYGDKTALLPHLVNEMKYWPNGTVMLGELCFDDPLKTSKDVGSILRCLAPKAIERQKDSPLLVKIFDCLAYGGTVILEEKYDIRLEFVKKYFPDFFSPHFSCVEHTYGDFMEFAEKIWSKGGEGIVIHNFDYKYQPGKRTAWNTLKVKKHLGEIETKVATVSSPTHKYEGTCEQTWPYWAVVISKTSGETMMMRGSLTSMSPADLFVYEAYPVTKFWFYGWAGAINVVYKGKVVSVSSGLTDEDREWLMSNDAIDCIRQGKLTAVISAMEETADGSLRHPVLIRLRTDL